MSKFYLILLSIMAVSCLKHQPISFEDDFDCLPSDSTYCVPVTYGDVTQIQFELSKMSDSSLITNGNFASSSGWTVGTDWAIGSGIASYTAGMPASSISRECDYVLSEGYYLVQFDILPITEQLTLTVNLGGSIICTIGGLLSSGFIDTTIYIYAYITPVSNTLSIAGALYSISIDNVAVYRLSDLQFDIKDCNSAEVFYTENDGSSITHYENPEILTGADVNTNTVGYGVINLAWQDYGLDTGCYCLCIKDKGLIGFEHIRNGNYATSDFWTISNTDALGWVISGGVAEHTPGGTAGNDTLSQTLAVALDAGERYTLNLDATMVSGSGSATLGIYYDTATLSNQLLTNLTLSVTGSTNADIDNIGVTALKFICTAAGLRVFSIDNISLKINEPVYETCECTTKCISLRDSWATVASSRKMCDIVIEGIANNGAFDFIFTNPTFSLKGRILGIIRNSKYNDVETLYKDLTGLETLAYSEIEKTKELQIYDVPEYVHDWIHTALNCTTVNITINGITKQFNKAGDYVPNWRKTSVDAPVIVEIKEAQQTSPNAPNIA